MLESLLREAMISLQYFDAYYFQNELGDTLYHP